MPVHTMIITRCIYSTIMTKFLARWRSPPSYGGSVAASVTAGDGPHRRRKTSRAPTIFNYPPGRGSAASGLPCLLDRYQEARSRRHQEARVRRLCNMNPLRAGASRSQRSPVPLNDKCADPPLRRWRREHRLCSEAPPRIDATDEIGPEASPERSVPKCIYLVGRRHPVRHPISSGVIGSVCLTPPSGGWPNTPAYTGLRDWRGV